MEAEHPARRRWFAAARCFAVVYVLGSLAAILIGRPIIPRIPGSDFGYVFGYWLLGPLSTLAHALYDHGDVLVGLAMYLVQSMLLVGAVLLWLLKSRIVRWAGCIATPVLWVGSGHVMAMAWYYSA